MEEANGISGGWERPKLLSRLCAASFINQGIVFPLYVIGVAGAYLVGRMPEEEVHRLIDATYGHWFGPDQRASLAAYIDMIRAHGVPLMGVFALRTLVRFFGTLRMWQGWKDGFHIYTTAQLLGLLLPMLVAGAAMFNGLGLFLVLNWCYLYYTQLRVLR